MLQCKIERHFFAAIAQQLRIISNGVIMTQRLVSFSFSPRAKTAIDGGSYFRVSADGVGDDAPALAVALYSVPIPRFTPMPEQDLPIWTIAGLFRVLARTIADAVRPTELRTISIRENDYD
ncbi:MAG TPA: hypothetical protein VGM72_13590 [Micropepsaceae bacterium]|jgi:hypothetical protein